MANSASLTDNDFCEYVQRKFDDPGELWESEIIFDGSSEKRR